MNINSLKFSSFFLFYFLFFIVTDGNASTSVLTVASMVTVVSMVTQASTVPVASTAAVASHTSVDITGTQTTTTASTNPPTSSEGTHCLTFSLDQTFTPDLSNQTSAAFQTLAATVIEVVRHVCICTLCFSHQTLYCTKLTDTAHSHTL